MKRSCIFLSIVWVLSAFLFSLNTMGKPTITPQELGELAAATSEKVIEIHHVRKTAASFGMRLLIYGGTSRELIDFVIQKINQLGSVDAYRSWLKSQERVHLLDWHKIMSDLDFLVVVSDSNKQLTKEQIEGFNALEKMISQEFPGNIF